MRAVPWETQPALDSWIQRECFLFPLHCFSTDNKDGTETFSNTNSSPYLTTCPFMFWRLSSFYQFVAALTGVPRKRSQLFDLIICVICIYLFLIVSTQCLCLPHRLLSPPGFHHIILILKSLSAIDIDVDVYIHLSLHHVCMWLERDVCVEI